MCAARAGRAAAGHRRRAMIGPMDADEPITLRLGGAPALIRRDRQRTIQIQTTGCLTTGPCYLGHERPFRVM